MKTNITFSEFGRKGGEAGSDFENALESARNEEQSTPTTPETTTGNDGQQTATPTETDDLPQSIREYIEKNPDHRPIVDTLNREFKSAFTPKLQEAAELRKQYEGLDPNVVTAIRHLQQLVQTDPRNAAEYLRQQAQLLEGAQTPEAQPTTPNVPEFATDVEELLYNRVTEMEKRYQEQFTYLEQMKQQQEAFRIKGEFAKLKEEMGVEATPEQMAQAWQLSELSGGKLSVTDAFFAQNRNDLLPSLLQKARDEASSVVQQKAGMVNPGTLATREGPAQASGPQDFESIWRELANG